MGGFKPISTSELYYHFSILVVIGEVQVSVFMVKDEVISLRSILISDLCRYSLHKTNVVWNVRK